MIWNKVFYGYVSQKQHLFYIYVWLGHQTSKNIVSEMTCTVSSGTLSLTQSINWCLSVLLRT